MKASKIVFIENLQHARCCIWQFVEVLGAPAQGRTCSARWFYSQMVLSPYDTVTCATGSWCHVPVPMDFQPLCHPERIENCFLCKIVKPNWSLSAAWLVFDTRFLLRCLSSNPFWPLRHYRKSPIPTLLSFSPYCLAEELVWDSSDGKCLLAWVEEGLGRGGGVPS